MSTDPLLGAFATLPACTPWTPAVALYELGRSLAADGRADRAATAFADAIRAELGTPVPQVLEPAVDAATALLLADTLFLEGGAVAPLVAALATVADGPWPEATRMTSNLGMALLHAHRPGAAAWHLGEARRHRGDGPATVGERLVRAAVRRCADMPVPEIDDLAHDLRRENCPAELAWVLITLADNRLVEGDLTRALNAANEAVGAATAVSGGRRAPLLALARQRLSLVLGALGRHGESAVAQVEGILALHDGAV
ncbi:hypothetical protein [Pseudonocardia pini]|uniref:hypothetical protein n=1 Tax=Pseudonocardia pini TaxID=2758030 RepID=UPI0015F0FCA6|nr:hypothetical protein [Pseudonocardia pini]